MPKIIQGLRESMLGRTRQILLEGGYGEVTIRRVARDCGVAVGTVYNYYPSKEMLVAAVMLQDWQAVRERMDAAAQGATDLERGVRGMYEALCGFTRTFAPAWGEYTGSGGDLSAFRERHLQLVEQITGQLEIMTGRLRLACPLICLQTAAQLLLTHCQRLTPFDTLTPALDRLLQGTPASHQSSQEENHHVQL